jgi:RHH-type proline utilization regulon transcriptional repressor/proline dehydrogenase/delta 1-pyrroline-5-carboxylate dehydrogenase
VDRAVSRLTERLIPLLRRAAERGVFVNFDIEQFALKDLVLRVFERCCEQVEFCAGLALQGYLRSADADAERLISWAQRSGRQVTVRLVKGAYWDYETIQAEIEGWPAPVWPTKKHTDACFERLTARFASAAPRGAGAANALRNGGAAEGGRARRAPAAARVHADRCAAPGHGVSGPAPAREHLERILVARRFPRSGGRRPPARAAATGCGSPWRRAARSRVAPAEPGAGGRRRRSAVSLEPLRDFADLAQREAFRTALSRSALPPAPADCQPGGLDAVLARALRGFRAWREADLPQRTRALVQTARRMRERRDELCGLVIRENGKTWRDADAEVCEAIDFCEYYARQAADALQPLRLGRFAGELDEQHYEPRGVAAVISPWNFPLAIACGMATAALVTGNSVVLKPAEQTPRAALALAELLWESGVPRDVLQLAPGPGETIGAGLVGDPRVALIAFTGSRQVGFQILEAAAHTPEGQEHVKHVVCEMGGKNAIIVDDTADLDEAVLAVRASAFGYQGQKCSACSRVIVLESVYELFLERLIAATRALAIGDPLEPDTDVGPLIDGEAAAKVREYIEIARREGCVELAMEVPPGLESRIGRPFVGPHIVSGIERSHRLANEEIFGPLLAVMRAHSFDAALAEAGATRYKLTGGIFSRQPSHLERARRELRVGNLYLNRAITGARVGRQPFGGLGWSGLGSQAGGRDYLLQFVQPRAICENTLRRGFSPEV